VEDDAFQSRRQHARSPLAGMYARTFQVRTQFRSFGEICMYWANDQQRCSHKFGVNNFRAALPQRVRARRLGRSRNGERTAFTTDVAMVSSTAFERPPLLSARSRGASVWPAPLLGRPRRRQRLMQVLGDALGLLVDVSRLSDASFARRGGCCW
jgi:hypothetical protein